MKPTFFNDIDLVTSSEMLFAVQVDFDLKAFNSYINSLLMSKDSTKISLARCILDDVINIIKSIPDEGKKN